MTRGDAAATPSFSPIKFFGELRGRTRLCPGDRLQQSGGVTRFRNMGMGGCEPAAPLPGAEELQRRAERLGDWRRSGVRSWQGISVPDFQAALDFLNRVAAIAHLEGHHPEVCLAWGRVVVATHTRHTGGLARNDFTIATCPSEPVAGYMVDLKRRLLLSEIELQCGFALKGYNAATAALKRLEAAEFWSAVQTMLAAAAHLHRFLVSDEALKTALRVADNSSLMWPELDSADDIRLSFSQWMSQHPRGPLRLSNFGPTGVSAAAPEVFARYIDLDNSTVVLFGRSYDMATLVSAIADLVNNAREELSSTQKVM